MANRPTLMMLWFFSLGIADLCARIISLYLDNVAEEGVEFMDEENHRKKITPLQLKGHYTYKAVGTSQNADPQVRLEHGMPSGLEMTGITGALPLFGPAVQTPVNPAPRIFLRAA